MLNDDQKAQLVEFLTAPIVVRKHVTKRVESSIEKSSDGIVSTQQYYSVLDRDMSDVSVGFYEIIYQGILDDPLLDNTNVRNRMFAGDTMNSFNRTANRIKEAGKSKKQRTPKEEWPEYLQEFHEKYHCLANFWVVPVTIGRTGTGPLNKGTCRDYMDRYLKRVQEAYSGQYQEDFEEYREYFEKFEGFEDFCDKHFLQGLYVDDDYKVTEYSDSNNLPDNVVEGMMDRIARRAEVIAESQYSEELWEYYTKNVQQK